MILVRTLLESDVWWYLCLDEHSEPFINVHFEVAWKFPDKGNAERVIRHLANSDTMKKYQFEVYELN